MRGVHIMFNQEKEMIKLKEEMSECTKGLSKCDKSISNVLHDVETRNFNAYEGYVLCKELKILRENRRCWKERRCELREAYLGLGGDSKLNDLKKNREKRKKNI